MDIDTHYTTNNNKNHPIHIISNKKGQTNIHDHTDRVKSQSSVWASLELDARKQSIFKGFPLRLTWVNILVTKATEKLQMKL